VHVQAHIVAVDDQRLPGVDSHANPGRSARQTLADLIGGG
jgi:hypothetical protein